MPKVRRSYPRTHCLRCRRLLIKGMTFHTTPYGRVLCRDCAREFASDRRREGAAR